MLRSEREALVALIASESGRPEAEVETQELDAAGLLLDHFTRSAHRVLQDKAAWRSWVFLNKRAYVRQTPVGVVGLFTPGSSPFLVPFGDSLPAWVAGNAVLLVPSDRTRRTALRLSERLRACGLLPEGLLEVALREPGVPDAVARQVDMIVSSGSADEGRRLGAMAGERLIPAVVDIGAEPVMIVAKDAILERAAKAAVWARFGTGGPPFGLACVLVERPAYDGFCAHLVRESEALEGGRPLPPGGADAFRRQLDDARQKGGTVHGGGGLGQAEGRVSAALVLGAHEGMLVMREEAAGPVLPVMPVRSVADAVEWMNSRPCGPAGASVWTRDLDRGEVLAASLETGAVSVNDALGPYMFASLPCGAPRGAGMLWRHSDAGLLLFCRPQSVWVHEWPAAGADPWWLPYSRAKARWLRLLSRLA
jgi:acyl-CoA reductase-like NAD-dependent aldehyde dehydrogenase